jgi:hypothetical protein
MRRYGRLLSVALLLGMLAAAVLFLFGLWCLGLDDLSPLQFAFAVAFGWGSLVLALTLSFIALRIGRYRGELGAALAEAQSVD